MQFRLENLGVLDKLAARFRALKNPDATPLMQAWMVIIEQDNRRGVLEGKDKSGNPLEPVTYRPEKKGGEELTAQQRLGRKGSQTGARGGFGPLSSGLHNNLSSSEYRLLGGPPLAPRGRYSRVVTNLRTEFDPSARTEGRWEAYGYWDEVVSIAGEKFLQYHFHGIGQHVRDLTGVRPAGVKKAKEAGKAWLIDIVRSGGV